MNSAMSFQILVKFYSDKDMPPVRAGFPLKKYLEPGMCFAKIKVKTGLQSKVTNSIQKKWTFPCSKQLSSKIVR